MRERNVRIRRFTMSLQPVRNARAEHYRAVMARGDRKSSIP